MQCSLLIRNEEALATGSRTTYVPIGVARLNSLCISHALVISRMVIYFLKDNAGPKSLLSHWLKNYHIYIAVMLGFSLVAPLLVKHVLRISCVTTKRSNGPKNYLLFASSYCSRNRTFSASWLLLLAIN